MGRDRLQPDVVRYVPTEPLAQHNTLNNNKKKSTTQNSFGGSGSAVNRIQAQHGLGRAGTPPKQVSTNSYYYSHFQKTPPGFLRAHEAPSSTFWGEKVRGILLILFLRKVRMVVVRSQCTTTACWVAIWTAVEHGVAAETDVAQDVLAAAWWVGDRAG